MVGGEDYAHGAFLASKRRRRHPGTCEVNPPDYAASSRGNAMIRKCFLAAVGAAAALAAAPVQARWVEARTQHFVLYANLSDGEAAAYAGQLERFDHLLRELTNLPATTESAGDRVTVYVVPLAMVQELAHSSSIGGFYILGCPEHACGDAPHGPDWVGRRALPRDVSRIYPPHPLEFD